MADIAVKHDPITKSQEWFQETFSKEGLSELHAHLMGMGDAKFWVNAILLQPEILPTNLTFKSALGRHLSSKATEEDKRTLALTPLFWDRALKSWVPRQESIEIIKELCNCKAAEDLRDKFGHEWITEAFVKSLIITGLALLKIIATTSFSLSRPWPRLSTVISKNLNWSMPSPHDFNYLSPTVLVKSRTRHSTDTLSSMPVNKNSRLSMDSL